MKTLPLREVFKQLAEMYEEDKAEIMDIETSIDRIESDRAREKGMGISDYYDTQSDEYADPVQRMIDEEIYEDRRDEYYSEIAVSPYEREELGLDGIEKSDETIGRIIDAAQKYYANSPKSQISFVLMALEANREKVLLTDLALMKILDSFPLEKSKLERIIERHPVLSQVDDFDSGELGSLFKQAGKTIDELPEQMLTSKHFMLKFLTSSKSKNVEEFLNGSYIGLPMTFGEIIDNVSSMCDKELKKDEQDI